MFGASASSAVAKSHVSARLRFSFISRTAIGALVGREVARVMMRFLNVTEAGSAVLPPFVLQTAWGTLGLGLGILVGAVAGSLIAAWFLAMRRSPTIELRVTQ